MPKKIILDADPGIVDAMVLCLATFDPMVEIVALTSVGGNVPADVSARNLQALVEFLDPPRLPRLGTGAPPDAPIPLDYRHVHGMDGLGGIPLPVAERRSSHPAEKVICDAVRSDPENVMILCLGPLTNIARAVARDPQLPEMIRHIYITGGAINGRGNITPCAEFNIYADVQAAKTVFRLPCTKTLVPLDITNPVLLTPQHLELFPGEETKLGNLLCHIVNPALKTYRQCYGLGGIHIHDLITYMVAVHPAWATTKELPIQIETTGYLTRGMTITDQRPIPEFPPNIEVVTKIKTKTILQAIFHGLKRSAKRLASLTQGGH
jgi:inosine-uridine nucleoside N-ribohydrolase